MAGKEKKGKKKDSKAADAGDGDDDAGKRDKKGKKKENKAADAGDGDEDAGKKEKKGKKKGKSKGKCNVDMLTEAAMNNVYYACHNVQELLQARGFHPPDYSKKKKKGKR